jgi:predicted nucleic acid-binding protein
LIAVLDASAVRTVMDPGTARARVLSRSEAEVSIDRALALVDKMQPLRELVPEVLALTSRTDSSVYDLFYLALAQRTGATLLTADPALRQVARGVGVNADG